MIYVNSRFLTKKITGVERYAFEMSFALKKSKDNMIFISPPNNDINGNFEMLNPITMGRSSGYFWEQVELPLYLSKQNKPLLINLTNTAPIFYNNQVTVIHDVAFLHNPDWYTKKASSFFRFIVKNSARSSKRIITVSEFSKKEIIKYLKVDPEKISVIYPGVPSNILKYSGYSYPNDYGNYILTVSSLEPRKNIVSVIEAFKKMKLPDYKLIVVGSTNKKVFSKIKFDTKGDGNIIFLGYVDDETLVKLYKNARLFVYLSLYEGFGFPPVEAISLGCPTLISDLTSLPEVCCNYAEYTNPFNTDEVASKIEHLLSEKTRMKNAEVQEFINKYNWQTSAKNFIEIINKID